VWMAWQYDRPEQGEGVVLAFRRAGNPAESMRMKLLGLDPSGVYTLTNLDVAGTTQATGLELMDVGLPVVIKDKPGSAIITYKKNNTGSPAPKAIRKRLFPARRL
jgi:alpha-galactosidase